MTSTTDVHTRVSEVAASFAAHRPERQARTALDPADFDALRDAGLHLTGLPVERGGLWSTFDASTRGICEIYRTLASGDSSVALVSAMHPAVLAVWLDRPSVPQPDAAAWAAQREWVFDSVAAGKWWGTITSEPGSGGDVTRTRTEARPAPDGGSGPAWRLTGEKHFGSGTGISSYMITTGKVVGEELPDWFYVPMEGRPLDGTAGVRISAPWDGHGMQATQSHGLSFDGVPADRLAWPGHVAELALPIGRFGTILFTSIVLGIVETAMAAARTQLRTKTDLRPYEQVEWAQAELEAWTLEQVYEGALRVIESGAPSAVEGLRAKTIGAQLAESCLQRICRVVGGATFGRRSPFGNWFEDVRALGFLRPPWALAFDTLIKAL